MNWVALLGDALPEVARRAGRDVVATLAQRLSTLATREGGGAEAPEVTLARLLPRLTRELARLEEEDAELRDALALARSQGNRRAALVEVLTRLESPDLEQDLVALDRHLDIEAVEDRLLLRLHAARQQWEFLAIALAHRARGVLDDDAVIACRDAATRMLSGLRRPWPIRAAACRLAGALSREEITGAASVRQVLLQLAHAVQEDPWVQDAALEGWLHAQDDPTAIERVLHGLLLPPSSLRALLPESHAFLRARVARRAADHGCWDLLHEALHRPYDGEHVTAAIATALARSARDADRRALARWIREPGDRVARGAAVIAALGPPDAPGDRQAWGPLVEATLATEDAWLAALVIRAVLDRLPTLAEDATHASAEWATALDRWATHDEDPDLANAAATLRRALQIHADPATDAALTELNHWLATAPEGASERFRRGALGALSPSALLEVLSVAAADGFDLSAEPHGDDGPDKPPRRGYTIYVGAPPRFAWWRMGYELARPRPDKRQAWSFLTDRWPRGRLVAMSERLAEVTPTLVPGLRQGTPTRLDWGAELPLPSTLLAAARPGGIHVQASRSGYRVRPTRAPWRVRAAIHRSYPALADHRLRLLGGADLDPVRAWDAEVRALGLEIDRTKLATLPLVMADDVFNRVLALDANTVPQLAAVSAAMMAYWIGRSVGRRANESRWRNGIPLVVGGWGSRGKSGTERLKAAIFHGLGYSVLSKTTGCEAMVVSSIPGREPTEIFLYRPYDKATIFEQRNVLRLAYHLRPQVLLWECMALNPQYVEILQQDWVRDDLTTITNTYPDHEDIQGPSGLDVAEVISRFIPYGGTVLTSEQHMTPILREQALRRGSDLTMVPPEEWLLLPRDLLARFPYNEHPRNIALVVRMARALGIERDVALRAMADHVVPDLGVLKEYGPVPYDGRIVSFVNGMSANERAGFLSNWARMGFDEQPEDAGLGQFTITVVNNRADRLARQGVFARIAALDVSADALVTIGTNVIPFHQAYVTFLHTDLRDRMQDLASDKPRLIAEIGRRLRRQPLAPEPARALCIAFGAEPADVDRWIAAYYTDNPAPAALVRHHARDTAQDGRTKAQVVEQWLRVTGWLHHLARKETWDASHVIEGFLTLMEARARPLSNSALTGDQVLHNIVMIAPPGADLRILGSCNIKGTGLDYVYRWLSLQRILTLTTDLLAVDPDTLRDRVRALAAHPNYGVADTRIAVQALQDALDSGRLQTAGLDAEVARTVTRLRGLLALRERGLHTTAEASRWDRLRAWTLQALDFYDGVRRRRESDALYEDLAARRVGQDDAAKIANAIVYRQK